MRRYGVTGFARFPFRVSVRNPFTFTRLHRFSGDIRRWHSDDCWCRHKAANSQERADG